MLRLAVFTLGLSFAGVVAYFLRWDATHCVYCRSRIDGSGRCPNVECRRRGIAVGRGATFSS